ncbi:MAG TPA: helix-turn-helix transcriptional regulator [Xanthomonadales bacterium]|nr:helix-turn-helix transcriptional regulator [Xanthomonadales bacterium]
MLKSESSLSSPVGHAYLGLLGRRVRQVRARRGMSRRILAEASGVSERYLAQLEVGKGNASIMVLNAIATAMHIALDDLVDQREDQSTEYLLLREQLRTAGVAELKTMREALRSRRIDLNSVGHVALIGLRGAGKSTLGQALAKQLGLPFVELVQEIEREAGMTVGEIFSLGGQTTYRRFERDALNTTLKRFERAVITVGGSLVSEPESYELLLATCYTVWLKASPREHMERVLAQGDHRPMADNRHAMADLKRILNERNALYRRADATVDTSGQTLTASLDRLLEIEAIHRLAAR